MKTSIKWRQLQFQIRMIRFNEIFSVKVNFWGYEGLRKSFNKNF
jgi:hypothetical protein